MFEKTVQDRESYTIYPVALFSLILNNPDNPRFQVHGILQCIFDSYLKIGAFRDKVYYGTLIENHRQAIKWYQFR